MKLGWFVVCIALVLLVGQVREAVAVTCNAMELAPCAPAIMTSAAPSAACCGKIREQSPCLCQYLRDPNLRRYINTGNAQRVARQCNTPFPSC